MDIDKCQNLKTRWTDSEFSQKYRDDADICLPFRSHFSNKYEVVWLDLAGPAVLVQITQ
jgi:hypothetical protein